MPEQVVEHNSAYQSELMETWSEPGQLKTGDMSKIVHTFRNECKRAFGQLVATPTRPRDLNALLERMASSSAEQRPACCVSVRCEPKYSRHITSGRTREVFDDSQPT
jgi:hypothetical protein